MKLRVSVVLPQGGMQDVTLSCDVTATVADVARSLIRSGLSPDPHLMQNAHRRLAPVTLRASPGVGAAAVLLDPMASVAASGLQSGLVIQPVPEFGAGGAALRLVQAVAFVEVLTGAQRGVRYSLIAGSNLVGRDRACRVQLLDQSVSRRHAEARVGSDGSITVSDLGSANGVVCGERRHTSIRIVGPTRLRLGEIELRFTPVHPVSQSPPVQLSHRIMHTRSPRVAPLFVASDRELPSPPAPAAPTRIPVLAVLAPMIVGVAMYTVTRSPMSLIMVAFSPVMMIGSWVDANLGGRRRHRKETARFDDDLSAERTELLSLREREIEARSAETPALCEVRAAIEQRGELLWTRRPEHRSFLEIRFGEGLLPSRTRVVLPERGETPREQWRELRSVAEDFERLGPVPVTERLERCGSVGVVGERPWAEGIAAALVLQLVGLHSPHELVLACFAGPQYAGNWGWLKWLPHVDPVGSPIRGWQLADSEVSATRLLTALEGLLERRRANRSYRAGIRSHLAARTRNDEAQGEAVTDLPALPAVAVLILDAPGVDPARLIEIAEAGPDHAIHVIWVSEARAALPAACRTFIEVGRAECRVHFVRSATTVPLSRHEHLDSSLAYELARRLAPVEDTAARMLDESDLPGSIDLRELHGTDLLGGAAPIIQAWASSGSLVSGWKSGQERAPVSLAAVVGQGPDGPAILDLRTNGPHALVGGTTGAGKSEFLQTWIMSMAATVSSDRLNYLLVDYKGGAAFAECVDLPHTVGLVTDLTPHLVRRALKSLRAELRYREELLAAHGAKDLISMERRSDAAAPPVLVIVIDEFAALTREVPEFVDGVIDVAQRGRSLGLHLVMATQRPAGVITDNLRANTNLRIALRMADEADSTDVIGVKDAAFFDAETPGRGAIKVGPGRITHFQTGYLGGRASPESASASIEVRSLGFTESEPWSIPVEAPRGGRGRRRTRDIERLRDGIAAAARQLRLTAPRRPWLDPLPAALTLAEASAQVGASGIARVSAPAELGTRRHGSSEDSARGVLIGLGDDPAAQTRRAVRIDFEDAGSISVIGAGGTGKTSALISLAAAVSADADRDAVQLYAVDAAGGGLGTLGALPTVGAVAPLADTELVSRVLRHVRELVAERGPRYAAARANGIEAYRATKAGRGEPRVILMVDGFAAFRQATEMLTAEDSPFRLLAEIMQRGRAVGVHVVLTADRPSAIPASMAASLQRQFVLRLANPHDYGVLGVPPDVLEKSPPGRAVLAGDDRELQFALIGGADLASQAAVIDALAAELRDRVTPAPRIVNAPDRVPLTELPASLDGEPVYGIDVRTLEPVALPSSGLGVIAGPSGSGVSQAALSCVVALERAAGEHGERVEAVLLSFAECGIGARREWAHLARGAGPVERLAARLVVALGGKPAASASSAGPITSLSAEREDPAAPPLRFPGPGARGVVVVERPAEAEGTAALTQLVALAKAARKAGVLVLFEFETGTASAVWELYQALKQPRWGISLQPDQHETQTPFREDLGRVRRAHFPPGRGFAIASGKATPVHVAVTD